MGMGYFQFGDIINNAAMNIYLQVFNGNMFLILLGIYLGVELLDYMVCLHLTFWKMAKLFSKAISFYISISNVWRF